MAPREWLAPRPVHETSAAPYPTPLMKTKVVACCVLLAQADAFTIYPIAARAPTRAGHVGMVDLSVESSGMKFPNPFVIGSGPPGTNYKTCARCFDAGWGGVVAKTVSLTDNPVTNVAPRYGQHRFATDDSIGKKADTIGFTNIELISDRRERITASKQPAACPGRMPVDDLRLFSNPHLARPLPTHASFAFSSGQPSRTGWRTSSG